MTAPTTASMDTIDVEARVTKAMDGLLRDDSYLLEHDANERSITHRLAVHLAIEFPGWHVDCEYNRDGHEPKRLALPKRTDVASDDEHATTVFPDIVVHHRGTRANLVVIEAKKSTNVDDGAWDQRKLAAFTKQLGYRTTVFIKLVTGSSDVAAELAFASGRTVRRFRPSM